MAQVLKYCSVSGAGAKTGADAANAISNAELDDGTTVVSLLTGNVKLLMQAGTYTMTNVLRLNMADGSRNGINSIVGVDNTWAEVDTAQATLNGGGGAYVGISVESNYTELKNLGITNYGGNGLNYNVAGKGVGHKGSNIEITSCDSGFRGRRLFYCYFERIKSNNNTSYGFLSLFYVHMRACEAKGNGVDGFNGSTNVTLQDCISHDNTGNGVIVTGVSFSMTGTICDSNGAAGLTTSQTGGVLVSNKFTNNATYGIVLTGTSFPAEMDWNGFYNNLFGEIDYASAVSDRFQINDISLTSDGYTNLGSDNFNAETDGEGIGYAHGVGNDITNIGYPSIQFAPQYTSGGGRQPRARRHGV